MFGDNGIRSLEGIQYFTALGSLTVYEPVTSLDLRKNTALVDLDATGTPLKSLKITGLKKLRILQLGGNQFKNVDIAGCTTLLSIIKKHYRLHTNGYIEWIGPEDDPDGEYYCFSIGKSQRIMKGNKLLRKYAKPKSIKFSKSSITAKCAGKTAKIKITVVE